MSQKYFWRKEYKKNPSDLTGSRRPSHAISFLLKFFKQRKKPLYGKVLELGSGRGRNAIFLAKKGFEVWGIDFLKEPLSIATRNIRGKKFAARTHFKFGDISKRLPFIDNSFDLVLDILASNTLNQKERIRLKKEVERVLKSGGYFLIYAPNRSRTEASLLLKTHPSKEGGTFIHPESALIEKSYYLGELKRFSRKLRLIKSTTIEYVGNIYGKPHFLSYICGIFKKL